MDGHDNMRSSHALHDSFGGKADADGESISGCGPNGGDPDGGYLSLQRDEGLHRRGSDRAGDGDVAKDGIHKFHVILHCIHINRWIR